MWEHIFDKETEDVGWVDVGFLVGVSFQIVLVFLVKWEAEPKWEICYRIEQRFIYG